MASSHISVARPPARTQEVAQEALRDMVELTKPGIVALCLVMTAVGAWLVPGALALGPLIAVLLGTAFTAGGANALNMYIERDLDRLMARTEGRPLPAKRMPPAVALVFALILGACGAAILWVGANPLTAALAVFAYVSYAGVYTPLKRMTPLAMLVGTIPGAMPPLMGWTALAGSIDGPGAALFLLLVAWQIPHFLAIALLCDTDYRRAGIRTLSAAYGAKVTRVVALLSTFGLIPVSLLLVPQGGSAYVGCTALASLLLLAPAVLALQHPSERKWVSHFFLASLIYLPLVSFGLVLGALWG